MGGEGTSIHDAAFDDFDVDNRMYSIHEVERIYKSRKEENVSENPLNEPSVIDILLEVSPSAAKIRDPTGRLPLHSAVGSGKGYHQGVQGLIAAYPEAVEIPDPETKLYPFMLAATAGEGKNNCSTIFELMRLTPEFIQMALCDDMNLKPKALDLRL